MDQAFGRYQLLSVIGEGGMGKVYKAHDTEIGRDVAIKVLAIDLGAEPGYRARFRREAHTVARLTEPHIVPIHDTGEVDGQLYLVMPVIDGVDLQALLNRDGPMSPERSVHVVEQLAAALDAAHAAGLVHRDVKPSNVLLTERNFAYLIDFGIAHDTAATKLTRTDTIVGTWAYMAPERFTTGGAESASDVYSLACVLYQCLTGAQPYPGDTLEQQFAGHMSHDPPRPSTVNPAIPGGFDVVIARGMAKEPSQRYPSATDLAAAARDALASGSQTLVAPTQPVSPSTGAPPAKSRRNLLIAAGVIALVAALVAGVFLVRNVLSPTTSGELVLTAATDPGVDPFMPPAASPPPTNTQAPPTLEPHGSDAAVVTQPLPGDREGLYGGTLDNAECERDTMIDFLTTHPDKADAFVEALNTDPSLSWSGGSTLSAADVPAYLTELTPMVLRLDTRVTNHGFDGTGPTAMQSVFEAGTAVLVDAHGVPRARCYCGNPLTAPVALTGTPTPVGAPWADYRPGALAEVEPTTAVLTNFVLVDVVSGEAFNRPAGTTGAEDTPHTGAIPAPVPDSTAPSTTEADGAGDISGTYTASNIASSCGPAAEGVVTITASGGTLTIAMPVGLTLSGPLNSDSSFTITGAVPETTASYEMRGQFTTEDGRWVARDATWHVETMNFSCDSTMTFVKQ